MTLQGAIQQLHDMRSDDNFPFYYKPAIDKVIETILTDAQEVRLGRWEMKEDPYGFFDTIPVCSVCGCTTKYRVTSAYCPNCGALMVNDEVEE